METSRSSTSSSRAFLRDVVVALLVLAVCEVYLDRSLEIFEPRGEIAAVSATDTAVEATGFYRLRHADPLVFFADLRGKLADDPVVFVGDSQGASALGGGAPYPAQAAASLHAATGGVPVVSLHLGGANAYEQGALLLAMLEAGIRPRLVVWSHSIFSQRKNQIRQELAATYEAVATLLDPIAANVSVVGVSADGSADQGGGNPARRAVAVVTARWDGLVAGSALVSFMGRPLWDKGQILRRSELGQLVPTSVLGGTARQFDPPASILRDAAATVGGVSRILTDRGICVVNFVSPIDRAVSPRPFSARAEAVCYPALEEASAAADAAFVNLLDAMPHANFGTYEDGTRDAFHFDAAGHATLAATLLGTAASACGEDLD